MPEVNLGHQVINLSDSAASVLIALHELEEASLIQNGWEMNRETDLLIPPATTEMGQEVAEILINQKEGS